MLDYERAIQVSRRCLGYGGPMLGVWIISALLIICATAVNARFDLNLGLGWDQAIFGAKLLAAAFVFAAFWRAALKLVELFDDTMDER